jgi:hypothetical protein
MKKSKVHASKAQGGASYLLGIMADAFPEVMVERDCYAHMVSAMPNERKTVLSSSRLWLAEPTC